MNKEIDREKVVRMYVDEKLSTVQISKQIGLSVGAIGSLLKSRGIKLRTTKESLKVRYPNGRNGKDSANWKGGRRKANKAGYIYIYKPDHPFATKGGNVMEHRVVLEEKIGRYLKPHEIAHHINGIKDDNRPENLTLTEKGKHTQEHFQDSFETKLLKEIIKDCPRCSKMYEEANKKESKEKNKRQYQSNSKRE